MNETWSWEDLRLFLAVARAGGLAGATATGNASAPTLSRRMTTLERSMGAVLFVRHRDGYELTRDGKELLALAGNVERDALAIERWRERARVQPAVKIAVGEWTAAFIAARLPELAVGANAPAVDLLVGSAPSDLIRREANLGLRNKRPETPGLVGQRLVRVEFAAYTLRSRPATKIVAGDEQSFEDHAWVVFQPAQTQVPSTRWLKQRLRNPPSLGCSSALAVLEAVRAGAGTSVLPCFIGDREPALRRTSDLIAELAHDQWLIGHADDRRDESIRLVKDWLSGLIRSERALFAGRREQPA